MDNFSDEFNVPDEAICKPILVQRNSDNCLLSDKGYVKSDDVKTFRFPSCKNGSLKVKENWLVTFGSSGHEDSNVKSEINYQTLEVNVSEALSDNLNRISGGDLTHKIALRRKFRIFPPRQSSKDLMAQLLK